MVELFEQDIKTNDRQSSKGNQLKWKNGCTWYKADYTGYEGLTEYMVSNLLEKSTLAADEYVLYDIEQIKYKNTIFPGVKSNDFLKEDWQIITLERLFQNFFGQSLYSAVYKIEEPEKRLSFLVEQVERITGLEGFGKYMNKLFTVDAVFLNEDRHTHNIAVLMDGEGRFSYCPIFDNGAGLLADIKQDYPLNGDIYELIEQVKAKTICRDFDEQLITSQDLYGVNLEFHFTKQDVKELLNDVVGYSDEEKTRVEKIIYLQMQKYPYLFV